MLNARDKQRLDMQAQIVRSLAHPIRLAVAEYLRDGEQCVCDIAEHVSEERSNVSRHLAVMLRAGVLQTRREGVMIFYSLRTPCILNFLSCTMSVLEHRLQEESGVLDGTVSR
jgi:DNA-binding transcriptional ArsR family regulator